MARRWLKSKGVFLGIFAIAFALVSCASSGDNLLSNQSPSSQIASALTVFRSPTCSCCSQWIEHMEAAGFRVNDTLTEDMTGIKDQYGVPASLSSCHTTIVDGYVVEGHIPAADVQRLLAESPQVAGIAVPGMPIGSPGMESGDYVEPYSVFSFTRKGDTTVFAEHS